MKLWLKTRVALIATVIAAVLAGPAVAQMSGREKAFVDGLRKRGMLKLVEQYLEDMEKTGGDALAIKEQQAGLYEMQGAHAGDAEQKAALFAKARQKYEELIKGLSEKLKAETEPRVQDELHMQILDLKVKLGELIWIREPGDDLNVLELSDRQIGDRDRVEKLMREGGAVFRDVQSDATAWTQQMQADPDMERRYLNTGLYEKVALYGEYSRYRTAWTDYYLAYVVRDGKYNVVLTGPGTRGPAVVKVLVEQVKMGEDAAAAAVAATPKTVLANQSKEAADALAKALQDAGATAEVQKEKDALLQDAIKKFSEFSQLEGKSREKWESFRMLGACYREQGLYERAIENLRKALEGSEDENFKIQAYYEMVQTAIAADKFTEARAFMDELRSKNYEAMNTSFIGMRLLPFLDAKINLREGRTDPQKKEQGIKQMKELWEKGQLIPLVSAEIRKYINKDDITTLKPFELWILADEAFVNKKYEEAQKYFEQFLKITQVDNPSHQAAIYNLAVCYYRMAEAENLTDEQRLALMKDAARRFFEVASQFPKFQSVGRAAESFVLLRSEIYRLQPDDENLQAYADALKWSLDNRTEFAEKANMRWLYGQVLMAQKKYLEAAQQFERVTDDSPNIYEAKYLTATCYRSDLVELKWPTAATKDLPDMADKVAGKLEDYASWAKVTAARSDGEVAKKLKEQGAQTLIWAAQLLVQEQVAKYERGLRLLSQCESDFGDQEQFKGQILRIKFSALFAQSRNAEAFKIIDDLIKSGEDVGDLLRQVLAAFTDEIQLLIRQGRRTEARQKLAQADPIGERFTLYLHENGQDRQIPLVNYQLAVLHKEAEDFEGPKGAIKRFLALLGFDPYDDPGAMEKRAVEATYLAGLGECYQRTVEIQDEQRQTMITKDPAKAYDYLLRARFYWQNVAEGASQAARGEAREEQEQYWWEAKYNELSVCFELQALEQKYGKDPKTDYHEIIRGFIRNMRAIQSPFGGPAMKVKFDRLGQKVGI